MSVPSRLLCHTAASRTKCVVDPGMKPIVIASAPISVPESRESRAQSPITSTRDQFHRDFSGSGSLACLRGSSENIVAPSHTGKRSVFLSATGTKVNNVEHHKNIVFPTEGEAEPQSRKLWSNKALSNGSHLVPSRKRVDSPSSRSDSPSHTGRRMIPQAECITGPNLEVTVDVKQPHPHLVADQHKLAPPYLTTVAAAEREKSPLALAGLDGYRPSGKKRIVPTGELGVTLLHHKEDGWAVEREKRGPRAVEGKSHVSVEPWNLASYTSEELHEPRFRPSTVVMQGPPAFIPEPMPVRARSPGKRHIEQHSAAEGGIFGGGTAAAPPISSPPVVLRGRSFGVYSPLRQRPPSSLPVHQQ